MLLELIAICIPPYLFLQIYSIKFMMLEQRNLSVLDRKNLFFMKSSLSQKCEGFNLLKFEHRLLRVGECLLLCCLLFKSLSEKQNQGATIP